MNFNERPIGFFDSGVGGLSVLKEAVKLLPEENFIYYGDSKNAPYGVKTLEQVRELTFKAVEYLISMNIKAVVIACNTATSAAIDSLREKYKDMLIIGIEPALKPAVELKRNGDILIMATPMTLNETKFKELMKQYSKGSEIVPMPCAGLVEMIENGVTSGEELNLYLREKLSDYIGKDVSAVVLGCTHYPFIKTELEKILKKDTPVIDGGLGTVMNLKRQMELKGINNIQNKNGTVEILNSCNKNEIVELSHKLLGM